MIRSNLAVILAENNLKITKVAHDTGISRTTLTALSQNNCKGIQFDTLDALCMYLHISVNQLISFTPLSIKRLKYYSDNTTFFKEPISTGSLYFDLMTSNNKLYSCSFNVSVDNRSLYDEIPMNGVWTAVNLYIDIVSAEDDATNFALPLLQKLSRPFFNDISSMIGQYIYEETFRSEKDFPDPDISVSWSVFNNISNTKDTP